MADSPQAGRGAADRWLEGGGELGERIRRHDWRATPLGPPQLWPQSLKTAVRIMLTSRQPIWIGWGPELTYLYNDPYKAIIGGKHPASLGRPFAEVWREIYDVVGPMADHVMRNNEGTYVEAQLLIMERHGYQEETYYTFSYSPIPDEAGNPGGIICANTEDTRRVVGERQLGLLRELGAGTANARGWQEACTLGAHSLASNPWDLPFAFIRSAGPEGGPSQLPCVTGIDMERAIALPLPAAPHGNALRVIDVDASFGELPSGAWSRPPRRLAILPIAATGNANRRFDLVVALNPFRQLDESYRGFLELLAGEVASSISNAQAYEEERKRAEALAELDRAKTTFFSNVSHEFRTPLTLMVGPIEDGLRDAANPLPGAQRERLELARRNGLRLQKLVNALLDFSRIEAGRAQGTYVPTPLAETTADIASTFRSAVEKAGLTLQVDCAPLGELAYVDRDMWERIVLNLISNAFKFTFEGGIAVGVRRAGERFELCVRDSGIGISADELPRMFERFRRVEGARSRTHEGTGIGLALVQELARLHGGEVRVESVEGRGSTFTVSIPRGKAHLPPERIGSERSQTYDASHVESYVIEALRWLPKEDILDPGVGEASSQGPGATAARERIVWADDNADMRDYVRRLLSPHYAVEAVADGEAALAAIHAQRPALVLADVMMPRLDGLGLLKALRDDPRTQTIPVILLSARAAEEARSEGLGAGADDYLYKPFMASELLARVSARIAVNRLQARIEGERTALYQLFEQTPVATAVLKGPDLRFDMANRAYVDIVDGREVVGKTILDALPEIRGQGFDELLLDVMRTSEAFVGHETPARLARGGSMQELYFTFIYAPLRNAEGDVEGVIAIVNEVTEQVRARQRIELLAGELREADRRKDEFLATLAHELRNPLAPLRNSLHLLRLNGPGDGPTARAHEMMERQVNHLVRLVDDLLEISRITRGTFELRRERIDVATVVRNAIETNTPLIDAERHQLAVAMPDETLWLDGDPVRIAQILANLINNAAKYTEPGGEISIEVRREGTVAAIAVRDNGPGIGPEALPQLFQMFNRGDLSTQRAQTGLGIGLALSRRLAEMHGGTVEARSDGIGRGSEFTVRLPLEANARPPPVRAHVGAAAMTKQRILVVDDNRDAAESLAAILEHLGADVHLAHDGPRALEKFAASPPEVVLLDIGMPGMDGYEVARRIRQSFPHHKALLVALTGWAQEEDRKRSRAAGFDHHLVKPAELEALESLLASVGERSPSSGR